MRLTVLGNGPVSPGPGGASSGYLVESQNAKLLLDCGTGVVAAPALKTALPDLNAILISHLHIDHWIDLVPLAYELKYSPSKIRRDPIPVWVPPEHRQTLLDLFRALMPGSHHAEEVFLVQEFAPETGLHIGDVAVSFCAVPHYIPAYAMRLEAEGKRITYSGDSAACEQLTAIANQCDLFLCEATDPPDETHHEPRGHMSALEAGQIAARAGVKRMLLTLFWHHYEAKALLKAARSAYSGVCEMAEQGRSYEV
jgi:ribonuclease BN (tRNA processing enzyme)